MENRLIPYQAVNTISAGPALILAPHPDDEVFGCGGAIMAHVDIGDAIRVVIVTDGGYPPDENQDKAAYIKQRQYESLQAARILGYGEPVFWDLPDRGVCYGEALVCRIMDAAKDFGARLLYAPSIYEIHPDHRSVAMAAVEAARRLSSDVTLALYEVGFPLPPNRLLNITSFVDRKQAAMSCFTSQLAIQDYRGHVEGLNRFRTYTLPAEVLAAEAYLVVKGVQLEGDVLGLYRSEAQRQQNLPIPMDSFNRPLVSVIVRTTGRKELADALDSIALQTYPNIEVLVVDAVGQLVLEEWCGRFPLSVWGIGTALARSSAANLGLDQAKGTYLIFLDDDDWFEPEHIAGLVSCLEQHSQAVGAYAGVRCRKQNTKKEQTVRVYNEPFDKAQMMTENVIPIHALLFRRSVIENESPCRFDERFDLFEDWDFWLQLLGHGDFVHRDKISANYRIHSGGGEGVEANQERALAGMGNIVKKWRSLWSNRQIMDAMARSRRVGRLLRSVESQRAETVKQLEDMTLKTRQMETVLQSVEQQQANTSKCLQEALQHIKRDAEQIKGLQAEVERLQPEIECLQSKINRLGQELQTEQEKSAKIDHQWRAHYELLTASRSWRWTAPLRFVTGTLESIKTESEGRCSLRGLLWYCLVLAYRSRWGRPFISHIPMKWKQSIRGLLRRDTEYGEWQLLSQPLVTIIIPVYKHSKYLKCCLQSALDQTYPYVEVIAVDDASPDPEVRKIMEDLSTHKRFKVFFNESNLGISATQNRALIESTGDIIGFLDCDDYLLPEAVERCLSHWNEDIVYLHSGRINVDECDREVSRISFEHLPRKDYFTENLEAMYATHFKLIRRDVFAHVGLFDTRFDAAQDYDMLMRIAFHYPNSAFFHLPEFVYYHRFHAGQATEVLNDRQLIFTETIQREARLRLAIRNGEFPHFLSIIMLSFGKQRQTLEAVSSLQKTVRISHEIILFDNGSDAQTVDFIREHIDGCFPAVRVIYHSSNLGPAAGRREALKYARGEWFLIFDNDEWAEPGWLEELLVRAMSQPDVGAVCCKVAFPNRRLQFSGGYIHHLDDELIELKLYDREKSVDDLATAIFRQCDWSPIGATLFLMNPADFLHEGYPNVFEDAGVSMALRRLGKRLLNSPASWVWHEHVMFHKDIDMKERYIRSRYDPKRMLTSIASFYGENGLIIQDEYVWRENKLFELNREELKQLLQQNLEQAQSVVS